MAVITSHDQLDPALPIFGKALLRQQGTISAIFYIEFTRKHYTYK